MSKRTFNLPEIFNAKIETALQACGYSVSSPKKLADAVLKLSDHYTQNPLAASPWKESWAQAASIAYYFPLNYARNRAVAAEANRLGFFEGLNHYVDVGSGMGPALFAFTEAHSFATTLAVDHSAEGLALAQALNANKINFHTEVADITVMMERLKKAESLSKTLLTASYVLTELINTPQLIFGFEALAIIEPSTSADSRQLMLLRQQLIDRGFQIWGPCTHQGACPLLTHSAKDWCHDRIHWQAPDWWMKIESHLPMKNRTLTYSYLLARREQAPPHKIRELGRLTGDMLVEKGKTRQSFCRSEAREFLSWFPQRMPKTEQLALQRGSLVSFTRPMADYETRAAELRLKSASDITEIEPLETLADKKS